MSLTRNDFNGVITLTAPTGGVTVDTMLSISDLVVIPLESADATAAFQATIVNAHIGKKVNGAPKTAGTGLDWIQGEALFWDDSADEYTTVATGNNFGGWAAETAVIGATVGDVICGFGQAIV